MEANHDGDGAIARTMHHKRRKFTDAYYGKTAAHQEAFYQELVYHMLIEMNTLEMRAICLVCGHYPLAVWAGRVCERFNRAFSDSQAFAGTEVDYVRKCKDVGGDHAAKWETSYLWYLRPDCVDMSVYRGREDEPLIGIMGEDPRTTASVEIGRKGCSRIVDGMVRKARELLKQAKH